MQKNCTFPFFSFFLVTLSALLYVSALLTPTYAWWGAFLFPVPLYLLAHYNQITGIQGLWWGILVFGSIHILLFADILQTKARYSWYSMACASLLAFSIVIYFSLYSGLWFWLMGNFKRFYGKHYNYTHSAYRHEHSPISYTTVFIWLAFTVLFIFWIDYGSLWPFLRLEGHPLMHPLIPLTAHPQLLVLLPILGKSILTLLLFLPATLFTHWLIYSTHINTLHTNTVHTNTFLFLLVLSFWGCAFLFNQPKPIFPIWLEHITWLPFQGTGHNVLAYIAQQKFKHIVKTYPNTRLIILPESAFYTDRLCTTSTCTHLWSASYLTRPVSILCGSFSSEGESNCQKSSLYNTCYLLYDGTVTQQFCKKHTMPFFEQVPSWSTNNLLKNMLFSDMPSIAPSLNIRKPFIIADMPALIPYICSELFFYHYPDDTFEHVPILALVKDSWTQSSCIHQLMVHAAQLKAILWQREILYISYTHACYITQNGVRHAVSPYTAKDTLIIHSN